MWSNRSFNTTHDAAEIAHASPIPTSPFEPSEIGQEDDAFKKEVIKDILCQIDYRAAWRQRVVDLPYDELAN